MTASLARIPRDVDRIQSWSDFDPARTPPGISPALMDVLHRWHRLKGNRRAPSRNDFVPEDMAGHLGHIVLIDCLADGAFRLRLIGSAIAAAAGREATGATFDQAYAGEALDRLTDIAVAARDGWCGVHIRATIDVPGRDFIPYTALVLPLSADGVRVDMLIMRMDLFSRA